MVAIAAADDPRLPRSPLRKRLRRLIRQTTGPRAVAEVSAPVWARASIPARRIVGGVEGSRLIPPPQPDRNLSEPPMETGPRGSLTGSGLSARRSWSYRAQPGRRAGRERPAPSSGRRLTAPPCPAEGASFPYRPTDAAPCPTASAPRRAFPRQSEIGPAQSSRQRRRLGGTGRIVLPGLFEGRAQRGMGMRGPARPRPSRVPARAGRDVADAA